MCPTYTELHDSTYLDLGSYRGNGAALTGGTPVPSFTINVALVMDRASDPTDLLNANWAQRQDQLAVLTKNGMLWTQYGANPYNYHQVLVDLAALGIQTVDQVDANGYVSSAASRTIWVQLNQSNFTTLFGPGATLLSTTTPTGATTSFWNGELSLPDPLIKLGVKGLWFDSAASTFAPVLANPGSAAPAALQQGSQSPGNASASPAILYPQAMADSYYNFPLSGFPEVPTKAIGLVEPGVGSALPSGSASFASLLATYRTGATVVPNPVTIITVANGGQTFPTSTSGGFTNADERSIDVGIATTINPTSPLVLYAGSGSQANANSHAYTAYQSAIWDTTNNPQVVSSSFSFGATTQQGQFIGAQPSPGSPFHFAEQQLFLDAALRNMSLFSSAGDRGSGDGFGNGLTNIARESPYNVLVGGTSLSPLSAAVTDPTLFDILTAAVANHPTIIWQLIAGGLNTLPSAAANSAALVETVWNNYQLSGSTITDTKGRGYFLQNSGAGGADPAVPVPRYQKDFGLAPTTADSDELPGRGLPDVSAAGGGNMLYTVPTGNLQSTISEYGTSASTPLWASLAVQINAVFHDQGLPPLGYMNDLLYIAAAIAPASFNDITIGNNTSAYAYGGTYTTDKTAVTPTGFGYQAHPGYDLATGLGSPNGLLLARALTAIGHAQWSYNWEPNVINADSQGGWVSGADQTLLIQTMSPGNVNVRVSQGQDVLDFSSRPSALFAWTSRMAQQVLQQDFDSRLVTMFDNQPQGALVQTSVHAGERIAVSLNGTSAQATQANLTSAFGFADFFADGSDERLARPVAIAEMAGAVNDQTAIVRVRQVSTDGLAITFYRVDDFNGTISGVHPGDPGYQALAQIRAYQMTTGGTSLVGPGYGNYAQTGLSHVNVGDLIASQLANLSTGDQYSAFAQGNETGNGQHVGHLWNYGLNTWGWEASACGGDRDFNDLVVGIDFTSAVGHGWLM